jgi:hypothetical protein
MAYIPKVCLRLLRHQGRERKLPCNFGAYPPPLALLAIRFAAEELTEWRLFFNWSHSGTLCSPSRG